MLVRLLGKRPNEVDEQHVQQLIIWPNMQVVMRLYNGNQTQPNEVQGFEIIGDSAFLSAVDKLTKERAIRKGITTVYGPIAGTYKVYDSTGRMFSVTLAAYEQLEFY